MAIPLSFSTRRFFIAGPSDSEWDSCCADVLGARAVLGSSPMSMRMVGVGMTVAGWALDGPGLEVGVPVFDCPGLNIDAPVFEMGTPFWGRVTLGLVFGVLG